MKFFVSCYYQVPQNTQNQSLTATALHPAGAVHKKFAKLFKAEKKSAQRQR